jgi:hypothetical protein
MATAEEIDRRVEQMDTPRTAKRSITAKRVSELAQRRAALVAQLADIELELGEVLLAAQDVIDVEELARFTDLPATDLTAWLTARTARKPTRGKRKRPSNTDPSSDTSAPPAVRNPSARPSVAPPAPVAPRGGTSDKTTRAAAEVA